MRSLSGQFDDAKKEKDTKKRNNTSQSAKTGRSIFLNFCTNLKKTYMKLVSVFGIARIFFIGAYAKSVTKSCVNAGQFVETKKGKCGTSDFF